MNREKALELALHRAAVRFWRSSCERELTWTEEDVFLSAQRALNPLLADASLLAPLGRRPNPYAS